MIRIKKKNNFVMLAFALMLILSFSAVSVSAFDWAIVTVRVPGGGGHSAGDNPADNPYDCGYAAMKQTDDSYASFNGDIVPNGFGLWSRIVNNRGNGRSDFVKLERYITHRTGSNTGTYGYYYWSDVKSAWYEPSNNWAKLHFSADWR